MDPDVASTAAPDLKPLLDAKAPSANRVAGVRQYHRIAVGLGLTDAVAILAAFALAYAFRFGAGFAGIRFLGVGLVALPIWIGIFGAFRLYSVYRYSPVEEFRRVIYSVTIGISLIVTASYWTKADLSRAWVGMSWVLALVFVLAGRRMWHQAMWRMRQKGKLTFKTLIVGTNEEAVHLAQVMQRRNVGFEAIGFVSTGNGRVELGGIPIVSDVAGLSEAIRRTGAECVYVASSALKTTDMRTVTKSARVEGLEVRVSANIPEMLSSRLSAQPLGGLMAFSVWPVRLTGFQATLKRTFDVLLAGLLLIVTSPLWLFVAIAVKTTSKGPLLYRQIRVGRRGKPFTLLKFRTMVVDADQMLAEMRSSNEAPAPLFKVRNDSRVTNVGRRLRRWSLDELPQFWNVLRGDMSLVGPRPPLPSEVEEYELWHRDRLEVRPGITGLWQVSGRSELSFDDYVRLDLFYIENWSPAFDLYLLAKTGPAVLLGRGAF